MDFKNRPPVQKGDVVFSAIEENMLQHNTPNNDDRDLRIASYAVVAADTVVRAMDQPLEAEAVFAIGEGLSETPMFSDRESTMFKANFNMAAGSAVVDVRRGESA